MTNPRHAISINQAQVDPTRRTALVTGILYLITFAASIPAVFLLGPILDDPSYVIGSGARRSDRPRRRPRHGERARGHRHRGRRLLGGQARARGLRPRLRHDPDAGGCDHRHRCREPAGAPDPATGRRRGRDAGAAVVVGRTLVAVRDWTFVLGPVLMPALNALMFGTLLYRGRLVPRAIPALGLVGAPVAIAFVIATMLGFSEQGSTFQGIAGAPFFIWELAVGLWMTFKGFNRTAPVVAAAIAEAGQPTSPVAMAPSGVAITAKAGAA